jgi:LuxR family maltose regulon positive regulatory protein
VLREGRLKLDERYCWLDTWAFEEIQGKIDALFKGQHQLVDGNKVTQLSEKMLTLYGGPFMANETDQSWYIASRERLHNKFLRSMSEIGRYWEQAGEWDKAISCYQKSLEADNQAEGFYRHLMICYGQLGRRAEALETYNRCRKTLHGVHGIEPSSETQAVYEKLMQQH